MQVKREQLKKRIGHIVPFDYKPQSRDEHVFVVYIDGVIPVLISSQLTKAEFDALCS